MRIFSAILLILWWVAMIIYHQQLYKTFGSIDWAEKQFWDSRAVYVLSGCAMITIGVFMLFAWGWEGVQDAQQLQLWN
jgi:uncharacterized BrkB/YihY/UPF0761 family membrane protein